MTDHPTSPRDALQKVRAVLWTEHCERTDPDLHTEEQFRKRRAVQVIDAALTGDQADRAGGDGRRQIIENCIKVVALEVYPDPMMMEDFSHNRKCQTAIESLNVVLNTIPAAPPSGNAGELVAGNGLLDMLADERKDWRADLERRAEERDLERHTINLAAAPPAPPQPAPDALRERIAKIVCCRDACILEGCDPGCIALSPEHPLTLETADLILAALSPAPVPSGEGTGELSEGGK